MNTAMTTNAIPEIITMKDLVNRAGTNVARPRVVFEGQVYDGTLANAKTPFDAIDGMKDAVMEQFEQVTRSKEFHGMTTAQLRVSLAAVLNRSDQGIPMPISNDPTVKPSTTIVDTGYDWATGHMTTVIVPAKEMSLPGFRTLDPKKWQPAMQVAAIPGGAMLHASILRCDEDAVEGLFGMVSDHAARNSIYANQVVDQNFNFIKMVDHKPENVAMTDELTRVTKLLVLSPLRYPSALDERGMPRKSGVFLYGPPGGGKTMVKGNCLYLSARLGACAIDVDPSTGIEGFTEAVMRAKVLLDHGLKVVVAMEDMEKLAKRDRAKILDLLDGTSSKQNRIIYIGTTNFLEQIDRAMLRPGRFDAVVECALPDLSAFRQLVNVLIKEADRGDIDYEAAFPYFEGYSYAFIANAVQLIIRAAIDRAKGDLDNLAVTTEDLIDAAVSVRGHHNLMQEEVVVEPPALDALFRSISDTAIEEYLENNAVTTHDDNTNYDYIEERAREAADSVVEARIHQSAIVDEDGERRFNIRTN